MKRGLVALVLLVASVESACDVQSGAGRPGPSLTPSPLLGSWIVRVGPTALTRVAITSRATRALFEHTPSAGADPLSAPPSFRWTARCVTCPTPTLLDGIANRVNASPDDPADMRFYVTSPVTFNQPGQWRVEPTGAEFWVRDATSIEPPKLMPTSGSTFQASCDPTKAADVIREFAAAFNGADAGRLRAISAANIDFSWSAADRFVTRDRELMVANALQRRAAGTLLFPFTGTVGAQGDLNVALVLLVGSESSNQAATSAERLASANVNVACEASQIRSWNMALVGSP
jgi:hypothetical protein